MDNSSLIRRAFYDAEKARPYKAQPELVQSAIPPGGDWQCVAKEGAITRSVMCGRIEVALVNPAGSLDDETEGQIAMAMRALPLFDAAMRCIIALAENPENAALIRDLAIGVTAFVEMPAPRIPEPEDS